MTKKHTTTFPRRPGAQPGERHHFAKLSDAEVDEVRAMYADGLWSYSSLAEKFGMSKSAIADIVQGRRRGPNDLRGGVSDLC